jgi:hypothetical protein
MPVVASVERRRQIPCRSNVLVAFQDVRDLGRVFPVQTRKRQAREPARRRWIQIRELSDRRCGGTTRRAQRKRAQHRGESHFCQSSDSADDRLAAAPAYGGGRSRPKCSRSEVNGQRVEDCESRPVGRLENSNAFGRPDQVHAVENVKHRDPVGHRAKSGHVE